VDAALAYLDAQQRFAAAEGQPERGALQDEARQGWRALLDSAGRAQAAALGAWSCGASAGGDGEEPEVCGPSVAAVRLVEPVSGAVLDRCGNWDGHWVAERRLGADAPGDLVPNLELTFDVHCPPEQACAAEGRWRADVELAAAGGPGGYGTGVDVRLRDVDVLAYDNLLLFRGSRPTSDAHTLFALLFDCSDGLGLLQWGSLAHYERPVRPR
jgi:hypothetical protein